MTLALPEPADDTGSMDASLSTQMSQLSLLDRVGTAVAAKGLDEQKQEGRNVLQLIASAAPTFRDPALGGNVDFQV